LRREQCGAQADEPALRHPAQHGLGHHTEGLGGGQDSEPGGVEPGGGQYPGGAGGGVEPGGGQGPGGAGGGATDGYVSPYSDPPGASAYQRGGDAYQGNGAAEANGAHQETGSYGNEAAFGNNGISDDSYQDGESASGDFKGLPRRVRQANLAPQLRASAAAAADSQEPAGVPPATAASLTDMRNTLSAMQRGWQQGRSQTQRDAED